MQKRMEESYVSFRVFILFFLPLRAVCVTPNCSIQPDNNTQREIIALTEKSHANLTYELSTRIPGKFRLEVQLCEADTFHTACTCRWTSQNRMVCKNQNDESTCEAGVSSITFGLNVTRSHSDVVWELLEQNSTPAVVKHSKLQVVYPPQITELTVNGQQINETHLVDENQEVSISCSFVNGNPPVNIRLINEKGHSLSSTKYSEGPLTLSLGVFQCDDAWPTITCEAPGSELNRSVSILVRCEPQLTSKDKQLLDLSKVLKEGLALRLRSYTKKITACSITSLSSEPVTKEVVCEVSGRIPELTLTVRFAANHGVGEGIWKLRINSEHGESSTTFSLICKTFWGKCMSLNFFGWLLKQAIGERLHIAEG